MNFSALILFAKLPRAGEVKTRLGKSIGMGKAADVYRLFAEHAFSLADEVHAKGIDVYIFFVPDASEEEVKKWVGRPFSFVEQKGETLGERMQNAFDRTFQDGAKQTVIIGTDVPELDVDTIHSAFSILSTHDIVVGPSTDSGYYLLGMKPPTKALFNGIAWSTPTVLSETLLCIREHYLTHSLLHELPDIDTPADYHAYLLRKERNLPS